MGRPVDVDDLITAAQVAERLQLAQPTTVCNWVSRYPDLPAPAWQVGRLRLWLWSEVRAWAVATGRLPADG